MRKFNCMKNSVIKSEKGRMPTIVGLFIVVFILVFDTAAYVFITFCGDKIAYVKGVEGHSRVVTAYQAYIRLMKP